jgi:hypothetical protein
MRAVFRLGELLLAGGIALAPAVALAQETPAPATPPPSDAVGPRELQNFTLKGTVTRPADQPATQAAPPKREAPAQAQAAPKPAADRPLAAPVETARTSPSPSRRVDTASAAPKPAPQLQQPQVSPEPIRQSPPASSVTVALPKMGQTATAASATAPTSFAPAPQPGSLAPEHKLPMWPWLLAALALGIGGAFLFWRSRGREAFAGGPQVDAFTAPVPAPTPKPMPLPRPAPPAPPRAAPRPRTAAPQPVPPVAEQPGLVAGIVSTRLRPWIEIGFQPLRCVLEEQHALVEFDVELFNSGSAAARSVLVEASLFNAGTTQDAEIGAFFQNPVAKGERIDIIPPLKRASVRSRILIPNDKLKAYELGGRQVFIPLIAFNALYSWGGGAGQTSASYMLGRDTKTEKLAPFRFDLGPRIFRGIGARPLPTAVRV